MLNSYKGIADNPSSVSQNATSYVEQMDALNRNIAGLNSVYEMQLKSISAQMENIERINAGLNRIREMYEGSVIDSSVYRNETEICIRHSSQQGTITRLRRIRMHNSLLTRHRMVINNLHTTRRDRAKPTNIIMDFRRKR